MNRKNKSFDDLDLLLLMRVLLIVYVLLKTLKQYGLSTLSNNLKE